MKRKNIKSDHVCEFDYVVDTRQIVGSIVGTKIRRRACVCGNRITTYEISAEALKPLMQIVKTVAKVRRGVIDLWD